MTALDNIQAAADAENASVASYAAKSTAIDAAVAAALRGFAAEFKTVYVDEAGGSDANAGIAPAAAVKTFAAAAGLIGAGQQGVIRLLSDVNITAQVLLQGKLVNVESANADGSRAASALRTLILSAPPAVDPVWNASIVSVGTTLVLFQVNLRMKTAFPALCSALSFTNGQNFIWVSASLTVDAGNGPLVAGLSPMLAHFANISLPAGYGGKLFSGVAAGVNPNGYVYKTNITSA